MADIKFWRTTGKYGCFSNFSKHAIEKDGKTYQTTEHYYQAMKATTEEDHEMVRMADGPKNSKNIARKIPLREDWESIKFDVMKDALRLKCEQHKSIKDKLLGTGTKELAEDSPYDAIWGLGPDGKGKNLLGKAWMEVREEISKKEDLFED